YHTFGFFFSSRRRHTRFSRDWSSDVCSSDLTNSVDTPERPTRWRFLHVVYRNYLVWRKLLGSALVGHLADPLIWLVGLGFGLGSLMPPIGGMRYIEFLASGMLCYSAMNSASFEGLWSAFTRLKMQRTWESILNAPMTVVDVVIGEWV